MDGKGEECCGSFVSACVGGMREGLSLGCVSSEDAKKIKRRDRWGEGSGGIMRTLSSIIIQLDSSVLCLATSSRENTAAAAMLTLGCCLCDEEILSLGGGGLLCAVCCRRARC